MAGRAFEKHCVLLCHKLINEVSAFLISYLSCSNQYTIVQCGILLWEELFKIFTLCEYISTGAHKIALRKIYYETYSIGHINRTGRGLLSKASVRRNEVGKVLYEGISTGFFRLLCHISFLCMTKTVAYMCREVVTVFSYFRLSRPSLQRPPTEIEAIMPKTLTDIAGLIGYYRAWEDQRCTLNWVNGVSDSIVYKYFLSELPDIVLATLNSNWTYTGNTWKYIYAHQLVCSRVVWAKLLA